MDTGTQTLEVKEVFTPEQVRERSQGLSADSDTAMTLVMKSMAQNLGNNLSEWLAHIQRAFTLQNEELALLREIEHHLREGTGTDEIWEDVRGKLDAYRKRLADAIAENKLAATSTEASAEPTA